MADPVTLALARRLTIIEDDNRDPNALSPQRVELDLAEGRTVACDVGEVLGGPERPLSVVAAREKFDACWRSASGLAAEQGTTLWDAVSALDSLDDVRSLPPLAAPRR